MVFIKDFMFTEKKKDPSIAPNGKPMNNKSKNKEGIIKKLSSLKTTKV